jgi:hypothetical protein
MADVPVAVQVLDAFVSHAGEVLRPADRQGSEPQELEHLRRRRQAHAVGGRDVDERAGVHRARDV